MNGFKDNIQNILMHSRRHMYHNIQEILAPDTKKVPGTLFLITDLMWQSSVLETFLKYIHLKDITTFAVTWNPLLNLQNFVTISYKKISSFVKQVTKVHEFVDWQQDVFFQVFFFF